jgi:hypothetical protein
MAITHRFLKDQSGRPIEFKRMTSERCPTCGVAHKACLGVIFETDTAETVQCENCDYAVTRPKRDPPGRRMNQRTVDQV